MPNKLGRLFCRAVVKTAVRRPQGARRVRHRHTARPRRHLSTGLVPQHLGIGPHASPG
ncbi:hypothetical protein [Streptomyces sp. JNUCC 63]